MKCGIVDVGSNTIRLSIYHWEGRNFKLLMNKKEMAGLEVGGQAVLGRQAL